MQSKRVSFENSAGENLAGILDLPIGSPRAYALFAHCFTCSKNLRATSNISRALTDAGFAVLRFDFTGLGQSEGEFADSNFSSNVDDLVVAAKYLQEQHEAPALLLGHSLGGTAVLQAAHDIPSAKAVATIGAPADTAHVANLLAAATDELEQHGVAEIHLGGRPFIIKQQFLDDISRQPMPESLGKLRKAVMILHAPLDDTVELENASRLFGAAKHPKSFVSLDNADHLLSRSQDSRYAGEIIGSWAIRYLPSEEEEEKPLTTISEGTVLATTDIDGFHTNVQAGPHRLIADEPASVGGTNAGPSPYGLLSAALASCTTMTIKMYASFKKLDLQSVSVQVTHDKVHATDCENCETENGKVDTFYRELSFRGDLTDEQRNRLLEIADRCPVHKTLHSEVKVRTRLAPQQQ